MVLVCHQFIKLEKKTLIRLKKLLEASAVLIPSSVYTMTLQSFYFRLLIHMGFSMRMYYASIYVDFDKKLVTIGFSHPPPIEAISRPSFTF